MSYVYAAGANDALTLLGLTKLASGLTYLDSVLPRGTSLMEGVAAHSMHNPRGVMPRPVADTLRSRFNELHAAGQAAESGAGQAAAHYADSATAAGPWGRVRAPEVSPTEATMPAFNLGSSTPGSTPAWMKGPGTSGPLPGKLDIMGKSQELARLSRGSRGGGTEVLRHPHRGGTLGEGTQVLMDPTELSKLPPRMV